MATKKAPTKKTKASSKKSTTKKTTPKIVKEKIETCFTIMPFGGWFDDYYEAIFRPAIEGSGLDPVRADDLYRPGTIVNDIWSFTQAAKIILADLTGKNPNVFYELGLAHALAKPVILVCMSMDDVPFDLRALRVIEYDKNAPNWGELLTEKITKSIKEVMEAPTEAVLPAFLKVSANSKPKSVGPQEMEFLKLRQEIDSLRREVRSYRPSFQRSLAGPDEAQALIKSYLQRGHPKNIIIRRLVDRGAPEEWVKNKLEDLPEQINLFEDSE